MADEHGAGDPIRILAPSGVTTLNIHGCTVHSSLGLPINMEFVALRGGQLASFQELWQGVSFVIIDEKSMLGLRMLAQIDARLQQIIPCDSHFGGLNVALCGDFAQLPPIGDSPMYGEPSKEVTPLGTLSHKGKICTTYSSRILSSLSSSGSKATHRSRSNFESSCSKHLVKADFLWQIGNCFKQETKVNFPGRKWQHSTTHHVYMPLMMP